MNTWIQRLWPLTTAVLVGAGIVFGIYTLKMRTLEDACVYSLINPLRCTEETRFENPGYAKIQSDVASYIKAQKNSGVTEVGVYFRDLRNGPVVSIDSQTIYIAASLLKLPVMIQYLKEAETNPEILDKEIVAIVDQGTTTNQGLPANQTLQNGESYAVIELLQKMIRYSDNNSRAVLIAEYAKTHPNDDLIVGTLNRLGVVDTQTDAQNSYVTLVSMASIFRILYNAAYLNPEQSDRALQLLVESEYMSGIGRYLPESVSVANKYGVYNSMEEKQLHDCGIVYYPEHPYQLCIMTKGNDLDTLEDTIATISKKFFDEVDSRFSAL